MTENVQVGDMGQAEMDVSSEARSPVELDCASSSSVIHTCVHNAHAA